MPGDNVLDVGCGTRAVTILAKLRVGFEGTAAGIDPALPDNRLRTDGEAASVISCIDVDDYKAALPFVRVMFVTDKKHLPQLK